MKRILFSRIGFLGVFFVFFFGITGFAVADTGTYTLTHQYVDLSILTDGDVVISYDIAMSVQSGSIPWVTVGLPSSNYEIRSYGGAASSVKNDNSGSWSGVYVSLDRTFYAGESFQFFFEVLQKEFVYKYNDNQASVSFTPSWWDNAVIENLKVTIIIPSEITSVTTTSQPTRYEGSSVIWEWDNVPKGTHKSTGVLMPLSAFSHVGSEPGSSFQLPIDWIILLVVILILTGSVIFRVSSRAKYEDPQVFSGGFSKIFRHINLECPNDGTRLQRRTLGGATINFCENCGGIYFDRGEIETLVEAGVDEQQFNTNQTTTLQGFTTTATNVCPRCHGTYKKVTKTVEGKDIIIYPCQNCGGIWVNKGTYQMIKEKRLDQDKLQQDKLQLVGGKEAAQKKALYRPSWWFFYPYIYYPQRYRQFFSPLPSQVQHSCACVSCACVSSCACACACAGGGAAGCAPKNTMYPQISFH
jgi:Zn-finger nucleic acid-binding protein